MMALLSTLVHVFLFDLVIPYFSKPNCPSFKYHIFHETFPTIKFTFLLLQSYWNHKTTASEKRKWKRGSSGMSDIFVLWCSPWQSDLMTTQMLCGSQYLVEKEKEIHIYCVLTMYSNFLHVLINLHNCPLDATP
ncbi:hypothetical protein mRhiFer1_009750 [Rhinolophus ferrumequinum]|uniref:Uncharacterized protein n=1 Tax=Rhinolophus ferrumequinum TaxID=59479 RepID=A0A7J7ZCV8_RHIFE|nr:hypothetical protein mRhiFer1_009750 [Rhinolophus ferrumequinum]